VTGGEHGKGSGKAGATHEEHELGIGRSADTGRDDLVAGLAGSSQNDHCVQLKKNPIQACIT
jgi:hypothetical protein